MFYAFRVNATLAELGISPRAINADHRSAMQRVGKNSGNSPQEVALHIASQLPVAFLADLKIGPIREWIRARKINPEAPEMREALGNLALWDLMRASGAFSMAIRRDMISLAGEKET